MSGLDLNTFGVVFAGLVFALYTAVLVYFGYDGWKHSNSLRDFVLGSRKLNGTIVGVSFGATYASANMFMGVPGMAYTNGTPALWWSTIGFGLPFVALALFAKRFWLLSQLGLGDMTLPEWIATRYDSPFLRAGTAVLSLFLVFYIVGQGVGAATMFETLFGIPYIWGLGLSLALVTFYVSIGGMHTTIMTDYFQGLIMLGIAVVSFAGLYTVFDGGMTQVVAGLHAQDPALAGAFAPGHVIFGGPGGLVLMSWLLFAFILMPHLMNRVLVLDNPQELRRFIFGAGISLFGMSVFMVWAGLAGRVLFPNLATADAVVPMYLMEVFPAPVAIIMVVGILSAILTTADSLMHAMTTIISNDLYKRTYVRHLTGRNPDIPSVDRMATTVGRLSSVAIAVTAFMIGMERPDSLFMLTQVGIAGLLSGTAVPIILGYVWSGSTKRGAEAAFVMGMSIYMAIFFGGLLDAAGNQFFALFVASGAAFVTMTIVSYGDPRESVKAQQQRAFARRVADGGESEE